MSRKLTIALLQVDSNAEKNANIEKISRMIDEAKARGAQFVALPEYALRDGEGRDIRAAAEPIPGPASEFFAEKARETGLWLHCGSLGEVSDESDDERMANTSLVFAPSGECVAKYRKIHLFDMDIEGGRPARESKFIQPGDAIATFDSNWGTMGLSICYDIRFPELYRIMALRGAKLIFAPASFRMSTGKDHWETLQCARAIENQCYMVAPAQIGPREGYQVYGRSLVVDPWGTVVMTASDREGVYTVEIDMDYPDCIRNQLPSLTNRVASAYRWP